MLRWTAAAAIFAIPVPLEVDRFMRHQIFDPLVILVHAIVFGSSAALTAKWGIKGFGFSLLCLPVTLLFAGVAYGVCYKGGWY